MPRTYYLENALIDHVLRNTSMVSPVAVYIGLFTVAPTAAGGGTEVSGGGYIRQGMTFGSPANGVTSNADDVNFPTASALWGNITDFGIFDAESAGNLLYFGSLLNPRIVLSGDTVKIPAGQVTITET